MKLATLFLFGALLAQASTVTATFGYDFTGATVCSTAVTTNCLDHFEIGLLLPGVVLSTQASIPIASPAPTGPVTGITGSFTINSFGALTISAVMVAKDLNGNRITSDPALAAVVVNVSDGPPNSGSGAAPVATPFQLIPIAPCRLVDTRNAADRLGGPALAGQASRDFPIPSGSCGIPSNAAAYSLNVTVVPESSLGYLTVWPTGQNRPNVSILNSVDGRVKANAAIVPAGTNGSVSVFASNDTHLILDINGYFVPAGTTSALAFFPLTPCRIADTRNSGLGVFGAPSLTGQEVREYQLQQSNCGIPLNAQAVSVNFTAAPRGPLGDITVWQHGQVQPLVSTLNASTGQVTANASIVPADIDVFASNDTDLVIDTNGYFASPYTGQGLSLYTLGPCRIIDTGLVPGLGPISGVYPVNADASSCAVPPNAEAFVLNMTVIPVGALGYAALLSVEQAQPVVSTLNASDGVITSNMAIVSTSEGSVNVFASNSTNLILDIFGYFAP